MEKQIKNTFKMKSIRMVGLLLGFIFAFGFFFIAPQTAQAVQQCELTADSWNPFNTEDDDDSGDFWSTDNWGTDCDEISTSFVEFEGGLAPPSGTGLDEKLTEVRNLRTFILNITKFALGFLGLIAVVIIIYGGFLFVTARGNEEQATNGKKSITYALVGIVVILASFAIVNTLIRYAPGGRDPDITPTEVSVDTDGDGIPDAPAPGTGARGVSGSLVQARLFNIAALEIQSSLQTFLRAYQRMSRISDQLDVIKSLPIIEDAADARNFLRELQITMIQIRDASEAFSKTQVAAKKILKDFVEVWMRATDEELEANIIVASLDNLRQIPFGQKAYASSHTILRSTVSISDTTSVGLSRRSSGRPKNFYDDGQGVFHDEFQKALDCPDCTSDQPAIAQAVKDDFSGTLEKIETRLNIVKEGLGPIGDAPAGEFVQKGITSEKELQLALAEIPPDMTVGQAFDAAEQALEEASGLIDNLDNVAVVQSTAKKLLVLYTVVRDIKFMVVRINANLSQGNAPLAVQFTSVGSLDPSNKTITDEQHEWDLDGNGKAGEEVNSLGCNEKAGAAVTCVYELPGTYRINLRLNPKGGITQVASGIGVFTLKVLPPKSRISLEAQVNDITEVLHQFDDKGRITTNKSVLQITLNEAKAGVRYDASKTTDGTGQISGITSFLWTFGDGSNSISGPTASVIDNPKKTYSQTGAFPLTLQVTDKGATQDRKFVKVLVTNIAARILAERFRGDLNTLFLFDGSRSTSDLGQIESFEWSILDAEGNPVPDIQNNQSDTFRFKFVTAGKYTVKLKVADQNGEQAETSVTVFVESQTPTASFVIRGCVKPGEPCVDPTQPSLVELDASTSFDPDTGDTLSYQWEVLPPASVNDYSVTFGALKDEPPEETQKIKLKFLKTGTYRIRLTVEDQHKDPELRRSHSFEQEIFIGSVVDLSWDAAMATAKQLNEEGKANFEFIAKVKNATQYKIDFGDSETFEADLAADSTEIRVEHEYDEAAPYTVKLTASSPENGETTIQKRIYVAASETPIAVISLSINDQPIFFEEDAPLDPPLYRGVRISFDASQSLNTDGTTEGLEYTWDFGDGERSSSKTTIHTYEDVSPTDPGYFEVKLTVLSISSGKQTDASVKIPIVGANPVISNLFVRKVSTEEVTPLDYEITAEGASDPDGNITEFTFWYFDEDDPERKLGVITTALNHAIITVETKGEANAEKKYSFCASVKDNENNIADCSELFPNQESLPFAVVRNGPNQAPDANFSADRTNILIGGSVTFTSSSQDPDGQIVKYVWDVLGDGFHNDTESDLSQITHVYDEKSPTGGYKAKLKVIDDKGASGFSEEIPIFVDLPFNPPIADFTYTPGQAGAIQFTGVSGTTYSRVAPGSDASLVSFAWDFDTSREFCEGGTRCQVQVCSAQPKLCDRDATNDPDATIPNPVYEYSTSGTYEVRLLIEDSNGQKDDMIRVIQVVRGTATPEAAQVLEARLSTDPSGLIRVENNRKVIHLNPPFGNYDNVTFFFGDSLGNIQRYVLDRNIYYDTANAAAIFSCPQAPEELQGGGDGCTDNDAEIDTQDGSQTFQVRYGRPGVTEYTTFGPEYVSGNPSTRIFRARLTVFGSDEDGTQITDTDEIDITFDPPSAVSNAGAFVTKKFGVQGAIIGGLVLGAILAFIGYWFAILFRKGKPREI